MVSEMNNEAKQKFESEWQVSSFESQINSLRDQLREAERLKKWSESNGIIKRDMIRTDLPEHKEVDGNANIVLALVKPSYYSESNTYLPAWQTMSALYYIKNKESFQGWIELEDFSGLKMLENMN
jgi:hypothetical protein